MLSVGDALAALDVVPVAIGFSSAQALGELAAYLDWPHRFLSDPDRILYRRLGLGRASAAKAFNAGTRAIYRQAMQAGKQIRRPVEDFLQLGGDAIAVDGTVVALWRPASPDDRPAISAIIDTVQALFG